MRSRLGDCPLNGIRVAGRRVPRGIDPQPVSRCGARSHLKGDVG